MEAQLATTSPTAAPLFVVGQQVVVSAGELTGLCGTLHSIEAGTVMLASGNSDHVFYVRLPHGRIGLLSDCESALAEVTALPH